MVCSLPHPLGQALQDYPGVKFGANFHVSDLAYAGNIVILSSSYRDMQGLLKLLTELHRNWHAH